METVPASPLATFDSHTKTLDAWAAHDGVPLLATVARALCVLDHTTGLDAFRLPYPPVVQLALDRTVVAWLRGGLRPPPHSPNSSSGVPTSRWRTGRFRCRRTLSARTMFCSTRTRIAPPSCAMSGANGNVRRSTRLCGIAISR